MEDFFKWIGFLDYFFIGGVALWGLYCVVLVLSRVSSKRFKNEAAQNAFMESIEPALARGEFDAVAQAVEGDERALPMMIHLAMVNRDLGHKKIRQFVMDRFTRDVLSDLDNRVAWIATCIKTAPMLGLFGTVLGMLGAFGNLEKASNANPEALAGDIRMALEHTAMGLAVAIPFVIVLAGVTNRIREMEQLCAAGLTRFLDVMKVGLDRTTPTTTTRSTRNS
jgi:biopolymer transport protein ExbB/TolQ